MRVRTSDLSITGPTRLPTALTGPATFFSGRGCNLGLKIWSIPNPGSNQRPFDHWPSSLPTALGRAHNFFFSGRGCNLYYSCLHDKPVQYLFNSGVYTFFLVIHNRAFAGKFYFDNFILSSLKVIICNNNCENTGIFIWTILDFFRQIFSRNFSFWLGGRKGFLIYLFIFF
jgi:hypothetical protein